MTQNLKTTSLAIALTLAFSSQNTIAMDRIDDDIPQWLIDLSLQEEIELQKKIETDIKLSLIEPQYDFSNTLQYDQELQRQEGEFDELLKTVWNLIEDKEHNCASVLINSFLEIRNLYPPLCQQAQDLYQHVQNTHMAVTPNKIIQTPERKIPEPKPKPNTIIEQTAEKQWEKEEGLLIELTNRERIKANQPVLTMNLKLLEAARNHSLNMALHKKHSHELLGKTVANRVNEAGYNYRCIGENIAKSQGVSMTDIVLGWMQSQGHKENMLNPEFTHLGVGIAISQDGYKYWTQVFGTGT